MYRVIIAVCFQICIKHINALCGQNVVFCSINWVVHIVTIGRFGPVNRLHFFGNTNTFDAPFSELICVTHYIPLLNIIRQICTFCTLGTKGKVPAEVVGKKTLESLMS